MGILAGQSLTVDFPVFSSTGALVNADSLPTGTLVINGTDNGATVTITNKATGIYKAAVTIPATVAIGDVVQIRANATVSTVASGGYVFTGTADNVSAQEIARITYRSKQVMFVSEGGSDSNSGLTPSLAKLTVAAAAAAASAEATILVEAGEYSEGTTPVELKAGQGLYGAGITRTRIHGSVAESTASKGTIVFADRTEVMNLTGENTLADTNLGAAFSAYLLGTGAPITFRCSNVRAIADADGFYLRGTNSSQYVYGYIDDCVIDVKFDGLARFANSQVTARNCKITTIGPSATGQVTSRAVVSSGLGGVTLINCDVFAKDGGGTTLGHYNTGTAIDMLSGCRLFATDSTGTIADLSAASTGTVRVRDTAYSTTTGTGTVTVLNTLADSNVTQMNGSTTPITALASQYDGSGLIGDTYPARQDQIALRRQMTKASGTTFETATDFFNGISIVGKVARLQATAGGTAYLTRVVSSAYVVGTDTTTVTVADTIAGAAGGAWYLWIEPRPGHIVNASGEASTASASGTGARTIDVIVVDSTDSSTVIENANIRFSQSGITRDYGTSNALGEDEINVDDGTYRVSVTASGWFGYSNSAYVVTGNQTLYVLMDANQVDPPSSPTFCVVQGYTRTASGVAKPNTVVEFKLVRTDDLTGSIVDDNTDTVTSDANGLFSIELPHGWVYDVRPSGRGRHQRMTVSDEDSQNVIVVIA